MAQKSRQPSSLALYLQEIEQYDLLTGEEERDLGRRVAQGDLEARNQMVRANLRLVVSIAREFLNRGLSLADLVAEGNLGLMKAVERFDAEMGTRFCTYAIWWIRQSIRRAVQVNGPAIRVPGYMVELLSRWRRAHEELTSRQGRPPTAEEMAGELGMSPKRIAALRRAMRAVGSSPHSSPDMMWLFEDVLVDEKNKAPEACLSEKNDHDMIQECLAAIDEREAEVLRLRYGLETGDPMTLQALGVAMGVSRERARQLETAALGKLARAISRFEHGIRTPPARADAPAPRPQTKKAPPAHPRKGR